MCLDGSSVKLEEVEEIPKETEGIVDIEVNNPDVAEVTLNENGCKIVGEKLGSTNVKFKCRDVETNVNINVNEKSVYENVDIGQYVDIGVYYDTPSAVTFTSDRTVTDKPLTGWRVLSKDDDKQTVKLISAGCPLDNEVNMYGLCYMSRDDDFNYNQNWWIVQNCIGFRGIGDNSKASIQFHIGDYLSESCKFYDSNEGVHGFCSKNSRNDIISVNDEEWCEDDFGEFLEDTGLVDTFKVPLLTGAGNEVDNASLKNLCGNKWKDSYNDLIDCGMDYLLGGSYCVGRPMNLGYAVVSGHFNSYSSGPAGTGTWWKDMGVRLVVELKKNVQILDVDGEDGSSEENAYSLFLSE